MEHLDTEVLGISERKWTGVEHLQMDNHQKKYSEKKNTFRKMMQLLQLSKACQRKRKI